MRKLFVLCLAVCALSLAAAPAATKSTMKPAADHVVVAPDAMKWGDPPPGLPKGAQLALLQGDPAKKAIFVIRLRMPDGYRVAPHWHATQERVTVISGTLHIGMGDSFDTNAGQAMAQGSYGYISPKMHHFAWTSGPTEIQIEAMGPFSLVYVNPSDDPRKK
jgi:hypothetical protein